MSNFYATVGRNVQYLNKEGQIQAAIVVSVFADGRVNLVTFGSDGTVGNASDVSEYIDTYDARKHSQPNTYRLNWQYR